MKIRFLLFLSFLFFCSCSSSITRNETKHASETTTVINPFAAGTTYANTEIIETFVDSLNIGEKGKYKIELIKHRVFDDSYVIVKFYTKAFKPNRWYIQNTYLYACNALMGLDPNVSDYNNDNYNDISFISSQTARSANEVRRLFIFDNHKKELISIVNAEDYPNMLYNKELNCIDAFLVYGGSSTVFAKIKNDSLIEFASVHNVDSHRTVYENDKLGRKIRIRKDTIDPDNVSIRYLNYKPLKVNNN